MCSPESNPLIPRGFGHPGFVFELKHDGFRAVAYIETGSWQLVSRKEIVYKSFVVLALAITELPVKNPFSMGIVCLHGDGRSQFLQLMRRRRTEVAFYAFDLLWLDGEDLRG